MNTTTHREPAWTVICESRSATLRSTGRLASRNASVVMRAPLRLVPGLSFMVPHNANLFYQLVS